MGKRKETILRVIRNVSRDDTAAGPGASLYNELITSLVRGDNNLINFKCSVSAYSDSVLEEDSNEDDVVTHLRFRHLTVPPPTLAIARYQKVVSVRLSCVAPVAWLFGIFVQLQSLETVAFGTGCFEDERCSWPAQYNIKLEQCLQVKELTMQVNILKFDGLEDESQRTVKNRIYAILDNATTSFPKLQKVDFCLPLEINPERFLDSFPAFKAFGYSTIDNVARKRTYKANANAVRAPVKKASAPRNSTPRLAPSPPVAAVASVRSKARASSAEVRPSSSGANNGTASVPSPTTEDRNMPAAVVPPDAAPATGTSNSNDGKSGAKRPKLEPGEIAPDEGDEVEVIQIEDSDDDCVATSTTDEERARRASANGSRGRTSGRFRGPRTRSPSLLDF